MLAEPTQPSSEDLQRALELLRNAPAQALEDLASEVAENLGVRLFDSGGGSATETEHVVKLEGEIRPSGSVTHQVMRPVGMPSAETFGVPTVRGLDPVAQNDPGTLPWALKVVALAVAAGMVAGANAAQEFAEAIRANMTFVLGLIVSELIASFRDED